jgi:glycosyltransferase involved in cell wall biosynthesis
MSVDLSVIVAVYNEDPRNLLLMLERLWSSLANQKLDYEVIFVNDGSRPKTTNALRQLTNDFGYVKLIELSRNFGQQGAIAAGLDNAEGRCVVNIDSDLQDPPELIVDMIKYWRAGYDVIYAQRAARKDRLSKRFTAFLFYRVLGSLSSIEIPMDSGDFRLIDRKVVDALRRLPEKTRFHRGLIPWLGFKQIGIPVHRDAREAGESGYTIKKLFSLAIDGLLSLSVAPLYLVPPLGVALILISFMILPFAMLNLHGIFEPRTCVILSALSFLCGIQVACTGIIAIYLAKVLEESRARPSYIASSKLGAGFTKEFEAPQPLSEAKIATLVNALSQSDEKNVAPV